jgi:hypothetical protein
VGSTALACACTTVVLWLYAGVAAAPAAMSIGQLDPGTPATSCVGTSGWVQSAESGAPSYVVPAGRWVMVSWSHRAKSVTGRELGVRVWRTTTTPGTYILVGAGALRTLAAGGINTFYERIAVDGGDLLGLRVGNPSTGFPDLGGGASCTFAAGIGNTVRYGIAASEPAVGSASALPAPLTPNRLNVTALFEPDADADGYGDETQDGCPAASGPAGGCAPPPSVPAKDTVAPVVKLSGRRDSIRDGRVTFSVTANEAVSVTARGRLTIASHSRVQRLRAVSTKLAANVRGRIALRLSARTKRAAKRALARRQKLRVRISVAVRDAAGNARAAKHTVRLVR